MYDPCETIEVDTALVGFVPVPDFYWIRLLDMASQEIEDIPVEIDGNDDTESFVFNWTEGPARCDCVRGLAFYKVRGQERHMQCGRSRMQLLGIWDADGILIHDGD